MHPEEPAAGGREQAQHHDLPGPSLKDGVIGNTATVSTPDAIDSNPANNSASVNVTIAPVADVAVLATTGSPNPVKVGVNLVYTTEIKNNGPSAATGVVLRQRLEQAAAAPDRMRFVSAGIAGTTATWNYVTFSAAPMQATRASSAPASIWRITNRASSSSR